MLQNQNGGTLREQGLDILVLGWHPGSSVDIISLRDTCRWGWVLRPGQIREVLAAMEFVFLLQGLPLSLPPASVKAALLVAALSIAGVPSHTKSLGHKI